MLVSGLGNWGCCDAVPILTDSKSKQLKGAPFCGVGPHSVPPQEHMAAGGNCQTFSSSTVISYSNTGDGAPKVYQETSEMRSAPGGVSKELPVSEEAGLIGTHRNQGHLFFRNGWWVVYSPGGDVARLCGEN